MDHEENMFIFWIKTSNSLFKKLGCNISELSNKIDLKQVKAGQEMVHGQ